MAKEKQRSYSWYAITTGDGARILEARCITYYDSPIGHAVIAEMDRQWRRPWGFVRSFLTTAFADYVGDQLLNVKTRKLAFYGSEQERAQRYHRLQSEAYSANPRIASSLLVDLGSSRVWPLPWLCLWTGENGYGFEDMVALTTLHDWDVPESLLSEWVDYGARGILPAPTMTKDEQWVLTQTVRSF